MADAATSDWSSGSSGWSGGGMWGAPTGYGMQSPYGSPYGGFSGGMPYGGGYPMQSPYGAPMGYGMPYGGMSPYGGYGMPQSMMAAPMAAATPQAATMAAASDNVTPAGDDDISDRRLLGIDLGGSTNQTTTFEPWQYQAGMLRSLYQGEVEDPKAPGGIAAWSKGLKGAADIIREQQALGPLGFDPSSEAGLRRMEQLAGGANPLVGQALNATGDIASGDQRIGTGGMFQDLYARDAAGTGGYQNMLGRDSIGNAAQYNQLYGGTQGAGSLAGGAYGQIASGGLMNANPFREKAIQDAMNQTSDQVKATMSARGRYGSDAYGDAMGRALGQVATTARMQGYDTDTANMMAAAQGRSQEALARGGLGLQAAQGLSDIQGTNAAQRLQQLQGLTGVQQQNWANQLGAAQGLTGVQGSNIANRLSAAGMAPQMQQLRYDDAGRMLQAGAAREAMAQQQRDFGWDQLNQYRAQIGNLPGTAGSATKESNKPWWETALGLASTAGGIWGEFGGGGVGGA